MSFLSPHFAQMFFDPLHCRQWMWYACFTVFCLQVTLEIKNWSKDDPIATIFIKRSINHLVSKKINRIAVCAQVADTSSESAGMEINRTTQEVSFPLFFYNLCSSLAKYTCYTHFKWNKLNAWIRENHLNFESVF